MSKHRNICLLVIGCVLSLVIGAAVAAEVVDGEAPDRATLPEGTVIRIGDSRTRVLAHPRPVSAVIGTIASQRETIAIAGHPGMVHEGERHAGWVLIALDRDQGYRGAYRYGWVAIEDLAVRGRLEYTGVPNRYRPRVLLIREPRYDEDPAEILYLDLPSGEARGIMEYGHEVQLQAMLEEREVLAVSVGTGPGSPRLIRLVDLDKAETIFLGHTWTLRDFIRDGRFVRVIPARPYRDAPGYLVDPDRAVLTEEPYRFSPEQLAEFDRMAREADGDQWITVHIVPERWLDIDTGDYAPGTEYRVGLQY